MEEFIRKYKVGLSIILGTACLFIGLYSPALSLLLLTDKTIELTIMNYFFVALGIVFLWGKIVAVAKAINNIIAKKSKE